MGIYDRDYYREEPQHHARFGLPRISSVVRTLIIINFAVLFIQILDAIIASRTEAGEPYFRYLFALNPALVIQRGFIWQFFTYMFLHSFDPFHILLNMLCLYFFGTDIEAAVGRKKFLHLYFLSGVIGGLAQFLFNIKDNTPIVGASGAVMGVLVAFAVLYPNRRILFFFFPIRARTAVYILIFINIIYSLTPGRIAAFAHFGGMLTGYLYIKHYLRGPRYQVYDFEGKPGIFARIKKALRPKKKPSLRRDDDFDDMMDRIIDKVHNKGLDSLTEAERQFLDDLKRRHGR